MITNKNPPDKIPDKLLFQNHSKKRISRWCKTLKIFYYKRGYGGRGNDGDEFIAYISISSVKDFLKISDTLSFTIKKMSADECKNQLQNYRNPGWVTIKNIRCFITLIDLKMLSIRVSGSSNQNYYEVSNMDFKNCLIIEAYFLEKKIKIKRDSETENIPSVISKTIYPELFT